MKHSTTIRISKETHDQLRFLSYKQNKRITQIIDDLLKDKPKPSISDKVAQMLKDK